MSRRAFVGVALLVGLLVGGVSAPAVAAAAPSHRALVIVDTGTAVYQRTVAFDADSITGLDALSRAGASPVVYSYAGQGGAVCRLFGVGRDAGPDCLGGTDGDNRYWAYFRAPAGATKFGYSHLGAGSTRVHDGDVEGWRFGTGAPPAFAALPAEPPPPPTAVPATPAATPRAGSHEPTGPPAGPPSTGTPEGTLPQTGPDGVDPVAAARAPGAAARAATARHPLRVKNAAASGSGADASLLLFAALFAAIVVAIVVARRARRRVP